MSMNATGGAASAQLELEQLPVELQSGIEVADLDRDVVHPDQAVGVIVHAFMV